METNVQSKIDKRDSYGHLELFNEDVDKASLENVCVEKKQEYNDDGK